MIWFLIRKTKEEESNRAKTELAANSEPSRDYLLGLFIQLFRRNNFVGGRGNVENESHFFKHQNRTLRGEKGGRNPNCLRTYEYLCAGVGVV